MTGLDLGYFGNFTPLCWTRPWKHYSNWKLPTPTFKIWSFDSLSIMNVSGFNLNVSHQWNLRGQPWGLRGVFLPLVMDPFIPLSIMTDQSLGHYPTMSCPWVNGLPWPIWHPFVGRIVVLKLFSSMADGATFFIVIPKEENTPPLRFLMWPNVASLFTLAQNSNLCYNDPQTVRYDSGDHFRHFGNYFLAFFLSGGTKYQVSRISKE